MRLTTMVSMLGAAAVPAATDNTDVFDITVQNDGLVLTLDPNSYG